MSNYKLIGEESDSTNDSRTGGHILRFLTHPHQATSVTPSSKIYRPNLNSIGFFPQKPATMLSPREPPSSHRLESVSLSAAALGVACLFSSVVCVAFCVWLLSRRRRQQQQLHQAGLPTATKFLCPADLQQCGFHHRNVKRISSGPLGMMPSILLRRSLSSDSESPSPREAVKTFGWERHRSEAPAFVSTISELIGPAGGYLRSAESDVFLSVPCGAITSASGVRLTTKVALGCPAGVDVRKGEIVLSPLVQLSCPDQTPRRPIHVSFPHRMTAPHEWHIRLVTADWDSEKLVWRDLSDSRWRLDQDHIHLDTKATHVCFIALGRSRHPAASLRLSSAVFASSQRIDDRPQLMCRLYIYDDWIDAHKIVEELELQRGAKQLGHIPALLAIPGHNWQITLSSAGQPDWAWDLEDERTKTIMIESCHRGSISPCVEFTCTAHDSEPLATFEATFTLAQLQENGATIGSSTDLLVHDTRRFSSYPDFSDPMNAVVTADQTRHLARLISLDQQETLWSVLALTETECQVLRGYDSVREQAYLAVSLWQAKHGKAATLHCLCQALESGELTDAASHLRSKYHRPALLDLSFDSS